MTSTSGTERRAASIDFPTGSWYAVATSTSVGRQPSACRVLGKRVVVYRDSRGDAVALDDRCCHSSYPLSLGRVEGDDIRCGYSGFVYGPDGAVRSVPTQSLVPIGAHVHAYPVREQDGLIWVWPGSPGRAARREIPALGWLTSPDWTTFGDSWVVEANATLLQDNFADITHIAHLDPVAAPPVLSSQTPEIVVTVNELTVSFSRDYPASALQPWQAEILEVPADSQHAQREEGTFLSPGLWVDRWDISVDGHGEQDGTKTSYFTHAITPIDERTTAHTWRVSRNYTPSAAATGTMEPVMRDYYRSVHRALETIQRVIDDDGPRRDVTVRADAAKVAVRKLMRRLAAEEA
ncbi:Rieske 2Fe-2S domain-containing protein [Gordonia sp. TBRC 11910]|uniref:Rieske 2Fe-2S domain-containing protein n=1 Tax=Gordonia asplenii TaxID=2725283 RepID=A0A848L107_9ACTN|nr:aromatic ring-hydroxylating dioxygenase subunit alpha [Gordonia asplenii]NMO04564.1 Rieske 2Fe-2S domain-containing protein [Gordonia asplenii]